MKGVCYYCEKERTVEEFENPHTHQTRPTCDTCKLELSLYVCQRRFFAKLFTLGIPLFLILSIVSFIFVSWKLGVLFICIAVAVGLLSYFGLDYFIAKIDRELSNKNWDSQNFQEGGDL